jgi:hypothetical protein
MLIQIGVKSNLNQHLRHNYVVLQTTTYGNVRIGSAGCFQLDFSGNWAQ